MILSAILRLQLKGSLARVACKWFALFPCKEQPWPGPRRKLQNAYFTCQIMSYRMSLVWACMGVELQRSQQSFSSFKSRCGGSMCIYSICNLPHCPELLTMATKNLVRQDIIYVSWGTTSVYACRGQHQGLKLVPLAQGASLLMPRSATYLLEIYIQWLGHEKVIGQQVLHSSKIVKSSDLCGMACVYDCLRHKVS